MPRISIGMPVYNGEKFIIEALDSILAQSFTDFELIISDNASTDSTPQICREYAKIDGRIRYHKNSINLGATRNYNLVFELSSGKYFKWAAHDDICAKDFLLKCIDVLDHETSIVLCYPKTKIIDEYGQLLKVYNKKRNINSPNPQQRFHDMVLKHVMCFEVFGLIRAEILKQTRLIGNYASSDRVLLGELSLLGRFFEIPEYLFYRRHHLQSSSDQFNRRTIMIWFDPKKAKCITLPRWRILFENYNTIKRAPLNYRQRISCYSVMGKWIRRSWKSLIYDLVIAMKQFISNLIVTFKLHEIRKWILRRA